MDNRHYETGGVMDASMSTVREGLRTLADHVDVRDAATRQFVAEALSSVDALASALASADRQLTANSEMVFLDGNHRQRLESLVEQQQGVISRLNATLDRVRAVLDLAQWSAAFTDRPTRVTVLADDVRHALND